MSETKFTPGPWAVSRYGKNTVIEASQEYVAEVYQSDFDPASLPTKSNAALIAAAPDLYAALVGVLELGCCSDEDVCGIDQSNTWNNARVALAKARGES